MHSSTALLAFAAAIAPTFAQTSTTCDPTKKTCPDDPALGKAVTYDMTQGAPQDFTVSTGAAPTFDKDGAQFTIAKSMQSPTMSSKWYMMFGHYDVVMKAAPGTGIVSSLVLLSDDLDEVDWEWLGADDQHVQSNYYGKGNTAVYDRGANLTNPGAQDDFHTYSVDWTADHLTWSIDGQVLRTLTPETADTDQYPQSPMQLKLGSWPAGDPSQPAGTRTWAGGDVDYTKGPFTMTVKSIKVIDYSTGTSYSYGDMTGTWQSIKSNGGKINSAGDPNQAAGTASASGTAITATTTGGVITAIPISATTTKTGELSSATGSLVSNSDWKTSFANMIQATAAGTGGIVSPSGFTNATGSGGGSGPTPTNSGGSGSGPSTTASGAATQTTNAAPNVKASAAGVGLLAGLFALLAL